MTVTACGGRDTIDKGGVLVLERQRVGHRGHLMGIPGGPHARARLPGRVPRPEEVRKPGT